MDHLSSIGILLVQGARRRAGRGRPALHPSMARPHFSNAHRLLIPAKYKELMGWWLPRVCDAMTASIST
jgi:hypothetical protein